MVPCRWNGSKSPTPSSPSSPYGDGVASKAGDGMAEVIATAMRSLSQDNGALNDKERYQAVIAVLGELAHEWQHAIDFFAEKLNPSLHDHVEGYLLRTGCSLFQEKEKLSTPGIDIAKEIDILFQRKDNDDDGNLLDALDGAGSGRLACPELAIEKASEGPVEGEGSGDGGD